MAPQNVRSHSDLVTPPDAIRRGFLKQALRKTEEADRFVSKARQLRNTLRQCENLHDLEGIEEIRDDLVTAAGFSDKATNYFDTQQLSEALSDVLARIADEADDDWRAEIVYRYLLTRGDSLGGSMRNITGSAAKDAFAQAVLTELDNQRIIPNIKTSRGNNSKVQGIAWSERLLLFDKTPKILGKNYDVILIKRPPRSGDESDWLTKKDKYIAFGEIKGGIDPAGADEHWKTANGALGRIRQEFRSRIPSLFFVGAAIEESMAREIFSQLQSGDLTHAANLTSSNQVADLASWLVSL